MNHIIKYRQQNQALKKMRYCYCYNCGNYKCPRENKKLKLCTCDAEPVYSSYQWIDYCNTYSLNTKTGRKI